VIDNLIFNVAQLLKDPVGATRTGDVAVELGHLTPDLKQAEDAPEAVLSGSVRLMRIDNGILAQGTLHAQVALPCARCLDPVSVPLDIELEEIFVPTINIVTGKSIAPEEEDQALWIDEKHILDLHEVLRQAVMLASPIHTLCQEDCRGLCATCGQNLNEGPCDCQPEPDPRWAALAALLSREPCEG